MRQEEKGGPTSLETLIRLHLWGRKGLLINAFQEAEKKRVGAEYPCSFTPPTWRGERVMREISGK
jgi:hypothetical protein